MLKILILLIAVILIAVIGWWFIEMTESVGGHVIEAKEGE